MILKKMALGKRIGAGFILLVFILCVVVLVSHKSIGDIVGFAGEVISGNELDSVLIQREMDNQNWANQLNAFITDENITVLSAPTDGHNCALGKWLYGQGRENAETQVPSLAPLFKALETPHHRMHASAVAIKENYTQADVHLPDFLARAEVAHLKWVAQVEKFFLENEDYLDIEVDDKACDFGKWLHGEGVAQLIKTHPDMAGEVEKLKKAHRQLHASADEINNVYLQVHPGLVDILKSCMSDQHLLARQLSKSIISGQFQPGINMDAATSVFGKFITSEKAQEWMQFFAMLQVYMDLASDAQKKLYGAAGKISESLNTGDVAGAGEIYNTVVLPAVAEMEGSFNQAIAAEMAIVDSYNAARGVYTSQTVPAMEAISKSISRLKESAFKAIDGIQQANRIYVKETVPAIQEVRQTLQAIRKEAAKHVRSDADMLASAKNTRQKVTLLGTIAVVMGLSLAFIISKSVVSILKRISGDIDDGARQVAAVASQVAAAGQALSEGSSDQAAHIETTSSSLEEIAAMIQMDADNTKQADQLMKDAGTRADQANGAMKDLAVSMENIIDSSEKTSKIIKTIDEIAFQTNLLALNAAVEAARAGEAGAGFAVVADEVRSLAMRAAEAANETSHIIEETKKSVEDGSGLMSKTSDAFVEMTENTKKVVGIVEEIAASANEQATGIKQLNDSVAGMDGVVQQNALSAKDTAAAAEEMYAQAEQMKNSVHELVMLIRGTGKAAPGQTGKKKNQKDKSAQTPKLIAPQAAMNRNVGPDEVLSLGLDDLEGF